MPEGGLAMRRRLVRNNARESIETTLRYSLGAAAEVDAAEVQAQDGTTGAAQGARRAVDDLVVQSAAVERMGMADERGFQRRAGVGLFKQGFEAPGGTGDEKRFDAARHLCPGMEADSIMRGNRSLWSRLVT